MLNLTTRRVAMIATLGVALAAGTLTGCGGGSGTSSDEGGTLTIAATVAPGSLDPSLNQNGTPKLWASVLAYEPLIVAQADGSHVGGLAESWEYSDNYTTFTMKLRPGVKFTDGSELTAELVVNNLEHYKQFGNLSGNLADMKSAEATGPLEVTLHLTQPNSLFPNYFDQQGSAGFIIAQAGLDDPAKLATQTLGAGPYKLDNAKTVANSSYVFVANPDFYDQSKVHWKEVIVRIFKDDNSILSAMQSGQVQVGLGSIATRDAAEKAGLTVTTAQAAMITMIILDRNGELAPELGDVRVRQALNYAIDREAIAAGVYSGSAVASDQYLAYGTPGTKDGLTYPYDVAKAKALLAEAGYPDGFSFSIAPVPGIPQGNAVNQALQAYWAAIGVNVTLDMSPDFGAWMNKIDTGQFPALTCWYEYNPAYWELSEMFGATGSYNGWGIVDEKIDRYLAELAATDVESDGYAAAVAKVQDYAVDQALSVPVISGETIMYSAANIEGVNFSSSFPHPNPTEWYLKK